MFTFFNDYKTYHLLKYEANIQNIRISEAMDKALIKYLTKITAKNVEELPTGKMKQWQLVKSEADKAGCTVAEFIERAVIEYCGLNVQVAQKVEVRKGGSIFDLNRDVNKK